MMRPVRRRPQPVRTRLLCQPLEHRIAPAVFIVTTINGTGPGSLRQAVASANSLAGADSITFDVTVFSTPRVIVLTTGEIAITDPVTISGPGADFATYSGNNASRVFNTQAAPAGTAITISGLTITGGKTTGDGGAILCGDEAVQLKGCVVSGNHADDDGGGLNMAGPGGKLTILDSAITSNTADDPANSCSGGGLQLTNSELLMVNTTVALNNAGAAAKGGFGGGVDFFTSGTERAIFQNCTISGNTARQSGGGVSFSSSGSGELKLQNCTITANKGTSGGGGGLIATQEKVIVQSCIISGNTSSQVKRDIWADSTITLDNSAIGDSQGFIGVGSNNLFFGAFLNLGPLAANGGLGQTHLPAPDSPVLNLGSNPAALLTDQRGIGFPRTFGVAPDIGAVETQALVVVNTNNVGPGSLRFVLTDANAEPGADTITFDPTVFATAKTISLLTKLPSFADNTTVQGPGANLVTVRRNPGAAQFRVFSTDASGISVTLSDMTVSNGDDAVRGGGIAVFGPDSLTLDGVVVTGNKAPNGGGVTATTNAKLVIRESTIAANTATSFGGGLDAPGAAVTVERSTFSGNGAFRGGGIALGGTGSLTVRNSTFSANTAGVGGAMDINTFTGPVSVQNSTITANAVSANGGGITIINGTPTVVIQSTIVSGNSAASAADISSNKTVTIGNSAIGSSAGFAFTDIGGNLPFGTNLKLGALAANGGPTLTHLPAADSPLVDTGSNPAVLTTDQRGTGFPRAAGGIVDIGAAETRTLIVRNANNSGAGSLRQAVLDANTIVGPDSITFEPAFFATPRTITLTSGQLSVTEAVSIVGPGSKLTTVSGNSSSRILSTAGAPAKAAVSVSGLTLTGCKTTQSGGAVFVDDEALTLSDCVITGNTSGAGGGAYVNGDAGSLSLYDCVVSNNATTGTDAEGGGIFVYSGAATVRRCTISGNTATGAGGGIAFYNGGSLLLENSTVTANTSASDFGGGIYFFGTIAAGGLTVRNSTVAVNTAGKSGGGLALVSATGTARIQNSTFVANQANSGGGGGIGRPSGTASLEITSSIISGNTNAAAPDISSGGTVSINHSAWGSSTGFTPSGANNLTPGQDLKLGPLAFNGGPTLTYALQTGSPAIDKGSNTLGLVTDQRGGLAARVAGAAADIGAFEVQRLVVTNANDSGTGSFRHAIDLANFQIGIADFISFDPAFFATAKTINLTSGELAITEAVLINGPAAAPLTVSGGGSSRVFNTTGAKAGANIIITTMTVTGGAAVGSSGGGFLIGDESVSLTDVDVIGNAASEDGGGIAVLGVATLTIDNCTIAKNTAASDGGGLSSNAAAKLDIRFTTIDGNTALSSGGGAYLYGGGSLTVQECTISGNSATQIGGGICFLNDVIGPGFVIRNSTVSGNKAGTGGGILFSGLSGTLTIQNSTITANTATGAADGGGGVFQTFPFAKMAVVSSVIAGNINPTVPDLRSGGLVNVDFSAIGSPLGFTPVGANNLPFGTDLKLGPLANNGGPTNTHLPGPDSPLRNAGSNPAGLAFDQRLQPRVLNGQTDIGSVETPVPPPQVTSVVVNGGAAQRSRVTEITVTFSTVVSFNPTPRGSFSLARVGGGFIGDFTAVANVVSGKTVVTITGFTGAETQSGSLADGRWVLTASATRITAGGVQLDGNGDGTPGDHFVLTGDPAVAPRLFRFFGDADGDGDVDAQDYGAFRGTFGSTSNLAFDFDGDGDVDAQDYGQFRSRFGASV